MGMNSCTFSGRVAKRPRIGRTTNGSRYVAFRIVIDERAYDPITSSYDNVATFVDLIAFGRVADNVYWRLHVGTQVTASCYLRNVETLVRGTHTTYMRPTFFVTDMEIGMQPKHVHDKEWWQREQTLRNEQQDADSTSRN